MSVVLSEPTLGDLEIDDGALGYCVGSVEVGGPEVRAVVDSRVLADGTFDRTRFVGNRTITIEMQVADDASNPSRAALLDQIAPYMHPGRRIEMTIDFDPSGDVPPRLYRVRGGDWSIPWENPGYLTATFAWVTVDGPYAYASEAKSVMLGFVGTQTDGRDYNQALTPGGRNLVTPNQASAEDGLLTDFAAVNVGCTLTNSSARADAGHSCVACRVTAANSYLSLRRGGATYDALMCTPAKPGVYTLMLSAFATAAGRTSSLGLYFRDASGTNIGGVDWGTAEALTANAWTRLRRVVTAPPLTAFIDLMPTQQGTLLDGSETIYYDRFGIFPGDVPFSAWAMPGLGGLMGRQYDRIYPDATPSTAVVTNAGNVPADWIATVAGPVEGFALANLDTQQMLSFPDLVVPAGETVVIDSMAHTVLANGEAGSSRYSFIDFAVSEWFKLLPGPNNLAMQSETFSAPASTTVAWRDAYL